MIGVSLNLPSNRYKRVQSSKVLCSAQPQFECLSRFAHCCGWRNRDGRQRLVLCLASFHASKLGTTELVGNMSNLRLSQNALCLFFLGRKSRVYWLGVPARQSSQGSYMEWKILLSTA